MSCKCNGLDKIEGDEVEKAIQLYLIELKIDGFKWKTLYRCKFCRTFWEERNTDDRFVGEPYLVKVTEEYVVNNWGSQFLEQ